MPKIYFQDTGVRNRLIKNFDIISQRHDKGHLLENLVYNELSRNREEEIKFWRTKTGLEVDFILDDQAIEVKYSCNYIKQRGIKAFKREYPNKELKVICFDKPEFFKVLGSSLNI